MFVLRLSEVRALLREAIERSDLERALIDAGYVIVKLGKKHVNFTGHAPDQEYRLTLRRHVGIF